MLISDSCLWMYNDETTTLSVMDMKSQKITVAVIKKINAMISIHQNNTIYYNALDTDQNQPTYKSLMKARWNYKEQKLEMSKVKSLSSDINQWDLVATPVENTVWVRENG